jgi:hypothetical protein
MLFRTRWLLAILLALAAAGLRARATSRLPLRAGCWTPDDYSVTVFCRGPSRPSSSARRTDAQAGHADGGKANLHVEEADVGGELDKSLVPL